MKQPNRIGNDSLIMGRYLQTVTPTGHDAPGSLRQTSHGNFQRACCLSRDEQGLWDPKQYPNLLSIHVLPVLIACIVSSLCNFVGSDSLLSWADVAPMKTQVRLCYHVANGANGAQKGDTVGTLAAALLPRAAAAWHCAQLPFASHAGSSPGHRHPPSTGLTLQWDLRELTACRLQHPIEKDSNQYKLFISVTST